MLRKQLANQPRTNEGGFWHKLIYPYQMWLDGLFMGEPFYAWYAVRYNEPKAFDDIICFRESDMIVFIQPALSCIVRNTQELGTRAVKTMLEIIEHSEESPERYPVIPTQLVLRDTRIGKQGRHVRVMQMRTLFTSAPQMLRLFNRHSGRICLVRKP